MSDDEFSDFQYVPKKQRRVEAVRLQSTTVANDVIISTAALARVVPEAGLGQGTGPVQMEEALVQTTGLPDDADDPDDREALAAWEAREAARQSGGRRMIWD